MRSALVAAALGCALVSVDAQSARVDQMGPPELYAAWVAKGESILLGAFPTNERFENWRRSFREGLLKSWEASTREPRHALFMLDVAIAALNRGYIYWLDLISLGGAYVRGRTEPPGVNRQWDQFELVWHKTVVALLSGRRRPDHLMEHGINPMGRRVRPVEGGPEDPPSLIDPWITLARGFAEDSFTIHDPKLLDVNGPGALIHYEEAMRYPSTRAEAGVRSAWLLIRMQRAKEALARLDAPGVLQATWSSLLPVKKPNYDDPVSAYWGLLFRGKALEALDAPDEAVRAYLDASDVAPSAPSPQIALLSIEVRRGDREKAAELARLVRTAQDPLADPWWIYAHGDLRFFNARLRALREMAAK